MLFRIVTEEHNTVGVLEVAHGEPTVGEAVDSGRVTRAERDTTDPVWRAQQIHKAPVCSLRRLGVPPRRRDRHALWPILIDHFLQALGDLVHRLLIADFLPAILTALTDSLERYAQTIGGVVNTRRCDAFEANILGQQGIVVCNDASHTAIF